MAEIRPPSVAGLFYPDDPRTLNDDLERMIDSVSDRDVRGSLVALIAPHAGYEFSGFTAAHGYALLKKQSIDTVVIVSPSHREYFDGISVFDGEAYATPLGEVPVERQLADALISTDSIVFRSARGHGLEHAVEVQLPFLQKVLGRVNFVPIVMGDQRREYCIKLADTLAHVLTEKPALLIASTDLSHYHSYTVAEKLDAIFINDVAGLENEKLMTHIESRQTEACGGGPTVSVMAAAKALGANHTEILYCCNSGDVTGDHTAVVGYLSAAITRLD